MPDALPGCGQPINQGKSLIAQSAAEFRAGQGEGVEENSAGAGCCQIGMRTVHHENILPEWPEIILQEGAVAPLWPDDAGGSRLVS